MIGPFDVGDLVRISASFYDINNSLADPTTVQFKYRYPPSYVVTYSYPTDVQLVRDSMGRYHVDVNIVAPGQWWFRWAGTGAVQSAAEGGFQVNTSHF